MKYKRIKLDERMEIFNMLYVEGLKPAQISTRLKRSVSSITREIMKGKKRGSYHPETAECYTEKQRKYRRPHLKITPHSWEIIESKLIRRWSPNQIANWLRDEYPVWTMNGKTIYNYINLHMKGELKKIALKDLRQRGKKRAKSKSGEKRGKIRDMTLIDERPKEVDSREIPGHWEGDLMIGKDHLSAIIVTVERTTRYVQLDVLEKYDAKTVRKTIERRFKKMDPN